MTLEILNGTKYFEGKLIFENVNLRFEPSNIYGLQGDNGSGKTVLLKVLAGYLSLNKGQVLQDNHAYRKGKTYIQDAGVLVEKMEFLPHLSLKENLKLLKWLSPNITDTEIHYWIDYYQLQEFSDVAYRHFSLGTKQKLALIQAFIHRPKILLLDEPMNALDEQSVRLTKKVLQSYLDKEGLVLLTSHISENLSDLCTRLLLIKDNNITFVK